jgi:hypothetical protein
VRIAESAESVTPSSDNFDFGVELDVDVTDVRESIGPSGTLSSPWGPLDKRLYPLIKAVDEYTSQRPVGHCCGFHRTDARGKLAAASPTSRSNASSMAASYARIVCPRFCARHCQPECESPCQSIFGDESKAADPSPGSQTVSQRPVQWLVDVSPRPAAGRTGGESS